MALNQNSYSIQKPKKKIIMFLIGFSINNIFQYEKINF